MFIQILIRGRTAKLEILFIQDFWMMLVSLLNSFNYSFKISVTIVQLRSTFSTTLCFLSSRVIIILALRFFVADCPLYMFIHLPFFLRDIDVLSAVHKKLAKPEWSL